MTLLTTKHSAEFMSKLKLRRALITQAASSRSPSQVMRVCHEWSDFLLHLAATTAVKRCARLSETACTTSAVGMRVGCSFRVLRCRSAPVYKWLPLFALVHKCLRKLERDMLWGSKQRTELFCSGRFQVAASWAVRRLNQGLSSICCLARKSQ